MLEAQAFEDFFKCFEFLFSIGDPDHEPSGVQSDFSLALGPKARDFNAGKNAIKGPGSAALPTLRSRKDAANVNELNLCSISRSQGIIAESKEKDK